MRNFLICLIFLCSLSAFSQVQWTDEMGCITCPPNIAPLVIAEMYKPDLHLITPARREWPWKWQRSLLTFGVGAFAGGCYGFHETAVHRPSNFPGHWNKNYWDNSVSWPSKWRNGDKAQGPAFWGSDTFLAWTVDAKHMFGTGHRAGVLATGIVIGAGKRRKWWEYGIDLAAGFAGYSLAFHSIWTYRIYGK